MRRIPERHRLVVCRSFLAAEPGHPVLTAAQVTVDSPRLQDVLTADAAFEVTVHEGFDFWVEGQELEGDAAASLERANETVVPTTKMAALPPAYWVRIGDRAHRWRVRSLGGRVS